MDLIWRQLQMEWSVIRQIPLISGIVWLLGFAGFVYLVDWLYRARLAARDDLVRMYQQKLGLGPHKKRPYSKVKTKDLRGKAIELAQGIRAFIAMADAQASSADNLAKHLPYVASQYINNFKMESILLRDEIMLRLPKKDRETYQKSDPKGMVAFVYQNPVSTESMGMVVEDLDRLLRLLPG